ncbi:type II toxin-antitoxin system HicB family antitoxin [Paraburkholderia azotifigens]|uniref:type II toxin-antitoxin system HicB family antitoxin n=1 Tax=Paraburkholderia azotifigens TaxID=2057004 RepID=UPI00317178FE
MPKQLDQYPAIFGHGGPFVVMFPDIPEAPITQGDTLEQARVMAADALLAAIEFYIEDTRDVPTPSAPR